MLWRDERSVGGLPWEVFGGRARAARPGGISRSLALSVGSPFLVVRVRVCMCCVCFDGTFFVEGEIDIGSSGEGVKLGMIGFVRLA